MSRQEAAELIALFDTNGDGHIDYQEFKAIARLAPTASLSSIGTRWAHLAPADEGSCPPVSSPASGTPGADAANGRSTVCIDIN